MKKLSLPKSNKWILGITALGLISGSLISQNSRQCGTMHNLERLETLDPGLKTRMQKIEAQTQGILNNPANRLDINSTQSVYNIPVVVHVVYNTSAQNISDAQIQSQIDVLNEDYRRLNADKSNTPSAFSSVAADCEFSFCLASTSPTGAATTGIIRKSTTVTSWSDDDAVKHSSSGGDDAWPSGSYLNLWVCNLGGGLLGYAQFPGGASSTDGVVILYTAFGRTGNVSAPYNKGRTATHEVGHWLNMRHIWGDANCGDDLVSDTPTQQTSNYGCPSFPHVTCSNGSNGDMFMNYMDYTDDGCMNTFTAGQKARMKALFASGGARASLLNSSGCGSAGTGTTTPTYCAASGNSVAYEYINNVTLNTINNTTTASSGYSSYTNLSTSLAAGSAYTISLKPGYASSAYTEYFKVYIDYNNDKDFADAGENVYTSAGTTSTISGSFTIPSTAVTGATRMRVMMSDGAISSPCGTYNYGEVEDYTINITSASSGSCGTPSGLTAGSITSSSALLSWAAVSGATSYNVHYKAISSGTWISTSSASTSRSIMGLSPSTQYEFQVQAVCSATGAYSGSVYFTTSATSTTGALLTVGTGTSTTGVSPYGTYYMDERAQFIVTQAELVAAGWTSANSYLRSLAFYATSSTGQVMNAFTIKIANTTATSFANAYFQAGTFTTVYSGNVTAGANVWNTYNFTSAFNYSGSGNLLIEICWNNSSYTNNAPVRCTATSAYRTLYYRADVPSGGVCSNGTGTLTYSRPNMQLLFKSTATGKLEDQEQQTESALLSISENELNVFPNPASDKLTVEFQLNEAQPVNVHFVDMLGRVMMEAKHDGVSGSNSVNFNVSTLEPGNYMILINENGSGLKKRVLITR